MIEKKEKEEKRGGEERGGGGGRSRRIRTENYITRFEREYIYLTKGRRHVLKRRGLIEGATHYHNLKVQNQKEVLASFVNTCVYRETPDFKLRGMTPRITLLSTKLTLFKTFNRIKNFVF